MLNTLLRKALHASAAALMTLVALTPLHADSGIGGNPELGGCAYTFQGCDQFGDVYQEGAYNEEHGEYVRFDYELSAGPGIDQVQGGLYRMGPNRTLYYWDAEEGDHGEWVPSPRRLIFDWCHWNFYFVEINPCNGTFRLNPPGPFHDTNDPYEN